MWNVWCWAGWYGGSESAVGVLSSRTTLSSIILIALWERTSSSVQVGPAFEFVFWRILDVQSRQKLTSVAWPRQNTATALNATHTCHQACCILTGAMHMQTWYGTITLSRGQIVKIWRRQCRGWEKQGKRGQSSWDERGRTLPKLEGFLPVR